MAKPDGRIEKGQRLASAISARAWNRAQDAADIVLGATPGVEAGDARYVSAPYSKAIVWWRCLNGDTERILKPGHFIKLSYRNIVDPPDTSREIWQGVPVFFNDSFGSGAYVNYSIGIPVEPIKHGSYGQVAIANVCWAKINTTNNLWQFVVPHLPRVTAAGIAVASENTNANEGAWLLQTCPFVGHRIVYSNAIAGEQWALIDLSSWHAQSPVLGKALEALDFGGSAGGLNPTSGGLVELYTGENYPTGIIVDVSNPFAPLAADSWVWLSNPYARAGTVGETAASPWISDRWVVIGSQAKTWTPSNGGTIYVRKTP